MHKRIRVSLLLALLVGLWAIPARSPLQAQAPQAAIPNCPATGHLISGPTLNRNPAWVNSQLDTVTAVGPGDVWALGDYSYYRSDENQARVAPLVEHWTGTSWQNVSTPDITSAQYPNSNLGPLVVISARDIWATGRAFTVASGPVQYAPPVLEHWDGTRWSVAPPMTGAAGLNLRLIAASGPSDFWAFGLDLDQTRVYHGDGRTWQETPIPGPPGVTINWNWLRTFGAGDAWLAGVIYDPFLNRQTAVMLLHWDGHAWTQQPLGSLPPYTEITAVAGASSQDVWAVGNLNGPPGPVPTATASLTPGAATSAPERFGPVFLHWNGLTWSRVPAPAGFFVQGLTFTRADDGWATGIVSDNNGQHFSLLHWAGLGWTLVPVADAGHESYPNSYPDLLTGVAAEAPDDLWAVGVSHLAGPQYPRRMSIVHIFRDCAVPTAPADDPYDPAGTYFPPTGHSLRGAFRAYWTAHGGLAQFGYPLTDEFPERNSSDGQIYTVQYFERNRFELHPENAGTPYAVLLGLLGTSLTATQPLYRPAFQSLRSGPPGARFFPATGHSLSADFRTYWEGHGGLAVYGYPISEPFQEANTPNGPTYLVQYFERNRLELHPELPADYRVSLGLLGVDLLRSRGWLP